MLKFLPIHDRSLIFFSFRALRFSPLSSTPSGSAARVLPRTINYNSPFVAVEQCLTARALRALVGEIYQITLLPCPKMRRRFRSSPMKMSVCLTLFQAQTCQCDRMYNADGKFSFEKRIKF